MTQKESEHFGAAQASTPVDTGAKLMAFLNSAFGRLLVGSLIGIIGLFTWQRQDWLFKEEYYRSQVLLDRRLDLVERTNTDVGYLIADADSVAAVFVKQSPLDQRNEVINEYNEQQAQWFGTYASQAALLGFYFPSNVSDKFTEIVQATQDLDVQFYFLTVSDQDNFQRAYNEVRQVSEEVRVLLQAWNDLALQHLQSK